MADAVVQTSTHVGISDAAEMNSVQKGVEADESGGVVNPDKQAAVREFLDCKFRRPLRRRGNMQWLII